MCVQKANYRGITWEWRMNYIWNTYTWWYVIILSRFYELIRFYYTDLGKQRQIKSTTSAVHTYTSLAIFILQVRRINVNQIWVVWNFFECITLLPTLLMWNFRFTRRDSIVDCQYQKQSDFASSYSPRTGMLNMFWLMHM